MCGNGQLWDSITVPEYLATKSLLELRTAILLGSYVDLALDKKPEGKLIESYIIILEIRINPNGSKHYPILDH